MVFIFSTNCPHSEKNLASWKEITESNKNDRSDIIGISLQDLDETVKYITMKEVNFVTLSAAMDTSFMRKYKIGGVPETILINGKSTVEKTWVGELTMKQKGEIESLISALGATMN